MCRTGRHRWNTAQREAGKRAAIVHQFPFTLYDMHRHRGLPVFERGKFLRTRHRNSGVAWNDFFHQTAHGFDAKGKRNNVE